MAATSARWRASDKQIALLRARGIPIQPGLTAGAGSELIDVAKAASALAPATPKQIWKLEQMGVATTTGLTKREASALIEETLRRRAARRAGART